MENKWSGWSVAVALCACVTLAYLILPCLITIPISFGNPDQIMFPPTSYSFDIFWSLYNDQSWLAAGMRSLIVALASTSVSLALGLPAAYVLARREFPGKAWVSMFSISPIMVPGVVIGLALYVYFSFLNIRDGYARLILGHVIVVLPFAIVTISAGLRRIDPVLEKAAMVMGASRITILLQVVIPLLKPTLVSAALLSFLLSFDEIVVSFFVQRAGYETLPVKMYTSILWEVSPKLAAISTLLFVMSTVICVVAAVFQPRGRS